MSTINLRVFKTEAGVHTQSPSISSFSTLATVSGVLTTKRAVEVLIKWVTSAWVEQSVYSSGTIVATKSTNPATGQTAYLAIPVNDFLAVAQCCATLNYGGGGGTGTSGGGRVDYLTGVAVADPDDLYAKVYNIPFTALNALAPIGILVSGNMQIDMGDGVFRTYPSGVIVTRTFADGASATIHVHHDDTPTNFTAGDDAGGFRGVMGTITGDIPVGLVYFQVGNSLANLPALPTTVKNINLSNTALNTAKLNTFLDFLATNGLTSGSFSALTNPRADATLSKLQTLRNRAWFVQAFGIYPNL